MIPITDNVVMLENETLLNSPEFKAMVERLKPPRKHTWRHYCCLVSKGEPDRIVTILNGDTFRPKNVEFLGKQYYLTKYGTAGGYGIYYEKIS